MIQAFTIVGVIIINFIELSSRQRDCSKRFSRAVLFDSRLRSLLHRQLRPCGLGKSELGALIPGSAMTNQRM